MYVKLNNGVVEKFPYTIGDLRKENPNVSFPRVLNNEVLSQFGVASVKEQANPDTDRFSYAVKRDLPELVNGEWVMLWDVVQKTEEEIAKDNDKKAIKIRDLRNNKLTATDWTQVADAPVDKAAWANYRQALRDIPSQDGFPWNVTWPESP